MRNQCVLPWLQKVREMDSTVVPSQRTFSFVVLRPVHPRRTSKSACSPRTMLDSQDDKTGLLLWGDRCEKTSLASLPVQNSFPWPLGSGSDTDAHCHHQLNVYMQRHLSLGTCHGKTPSPPKRFLFKAFDEENRLSFLQWLQSCNLHGR